MAIKIKPRKKTKKKSKPYYQLVYNYMIGDANGDTTKKVDISIDNPYVEKYCKLLNKLKPTKGHWGVILEQDRLEKHYKEKQITKSDYELLSKLMFENDEENEDDFALEFYAGVRSENEYSFLVFEGVELFYINECGEQLETNI